MLVEPMRITITLVWISLFAAVATVIAIEPISAEITEGDEDNWAALLEMNDFPEGWSDLPVEFINTRRLNTALLDLGWPSDHVYTVEDSLTVSVVEEAVEWLISKADGSDTVLLYVFTHGTWMRNVLQWNSWFPTQWEKVNSSKKILLIDTCSAQEFLEPIRDDVSPHISIGCCSTDEVSWAGLEEEGLPIIGSVWNHFFTYALSNSSADLDEDGLVSIEEAFNFSTPLVQEYMNQTVFTVPEFLESYHNIGIFPEHYDAYPHPIMDDNYQSQLVIPEFQSALIIPLLVLITLLLSIVYSKAMVK